MLSHKYLFYFLFFLTSCQASSNIENRKEQDIVDNLAYKLSKNKHFIAYCETINTLAESFRLATEKMPDSLFKKLEQRIEKKIDKVIKIKKDSLLTVDKILKHKDSINNQIDNMLKSYDGINKIKNISDSIQKKINYSNIKNLMEMEYIFFISKKIFQKKMQIAENHLLNIFKTMPELLQLNSFNTFEKEGHFIVKSALKYISKNNKTQCYNRYYDNFNYATASFFANIQFVKSFPPSSPEFEISTVIYRDAVYTIFANACYKYKICLKK